MPKSTNKLLTTLSALGLAAGVASMPGDAAAQWSSLGEFFDYVATSTRGDLKSKMDFIQAHPLSPAASRMVAELAQTLQSLPQAERQAMHEEIAALGGIPSEVPGIESTPFGGTEATGALGGVTTGSTQSTAANGPGSIY